ncbi:MAG: bifunctional diaminohydroxyphosphoribosylaminopyrimidine deaminase/5-amino-6-(5-phosphoribosylamino)uracil reductase RibD [Bacteriovoracaceae bacterium]
MTLDEVFMKRAFDLSLQGIGSVSPNPLVGAVIVKEGKIIAEGYHALYGSDHAELDAIKKADVSLEGATLYCTLEPCCHTNKQTPPCAQRIVKEKFKRVVIANLDPNPHVNGGGVKILKDAGIEVESGVLANLGEEINEAFFTTQRLKRPYIHLKLAATLDGKISMPNGESQWITSEASRHYVHELRRAHSAILVGAETARLDNPTLTVRLPDFKGRQPWRLILTKSGNLSETLKIFTDEHKDRTLILTKSKISFLSDEQQIIFTDLNDLMEKLLTKKIASIFVEGGPQVATLLLKENLVNRLSYFINPSLLGVGASAISDIGVKTLRSRPHLTDVKTKQFESDIYLTGKIVCSQD